MIRVTTAVLLCLIASSPAFANPLATCDEVRAYVAQYGKGRALAFAIKEGATWAQIREAIKCLRK